MKKPLYIFFHIIKTAGTTFRTHIERNYKESEILSLYPEVIHEHDSLLNTLEKRNKIPNSKDLRRMTLNYVKNLTKEKVESVKVIYGHYVPYGIHEYFNRPGYYFTFFRNPVDRIISYYNHWPNLINNYPNDANINTMYQRRFLVNGKAASFTQWFENNVCADYGAVMWVSLELSLKFMGYMDNGKITHARMEDMLSKFSYIGLTERFEADSLYLYRKLNFKNYLEDQNITKKKFATRKDFQLKNKLMRNYYESEMQIYNAALEENKKFIKGNNGYYTEIIKAGINRKFYQLMNWPED